MLLHLFFLSFGYFLFLLLFLSITYVTWSPLIHNDMERLEFESLVAGLEENGYFFTGGQHPVCLLCPNVGQMYINPLQEIDFPGLGKFSCSSVESAGLNGLVPESVCPDMLASVQDICQCGDIDPSLAVISRNPSKGIFHYSLDDATSIVSMKNSSWNNGPYLPMFLDSTLCATQKPLLFDQLSNDILANGAMNMIVGKHPTFTRTFHTTKGTNYYANNAIPSANGASTVIFHPVLSPSGDNVVGSASMLLTWSKLLTNTVPKNW
jgi:hypothetical protein